KDWIVTTPQGERRLEIRPTRHFTPKSKEPRLVPIKEELYQAIKKITDQHVSPFIVPGPLAKSHSMGSEPKNIVYRCDRDHRTLVYWLKLHGVTDRKPCHLLRKEFGSYVATKFGLFQAQRLLGHSSPLVTSAHYAGLTDLPHLA